MIEHNNYDLVIYTDGSCLGSPGTGGWACLFFKGDDRWLISGSKQNCYSLEMEIEAITQALRHIKQPSKILIYCDCKPLIRNLSSRINEWKEDGFVNERFCDSYREVSEELDRHIQVDFEWVPGHSGYEFNEKVDFYARLAAETLNFELTVSRKSRKFFNRLNSPENYQL